MVDALSKERVVGRPKSPKPITATRRPVKSGHDSKRSIPSSFHAGTVRSKDVAVLPLTRSARTTNVKPNNDPRRVATRTPDKSLAVIQDESVFPFPKVSKPKLLDGRKNVDSSYNINVKNVIATDENELYEMEMRKNVLNNITNDVTMKIASLLSDATCDETVNSFTLEKPDPSIRTPFSILSQYSDRLSSMSRKLQVAHSELNEIRKQIVDNINLADGNTVKKDDASGFEKAHTDRSVLPRSAIDSSLPSGCHKQLHTTGPKETVKCGSSADTTSVPNLNRQFQILGEKVMEAINAAVGKTTVPTLPRSVDEIKDLQDADDRTVHPSKDKRMLTLENGRNGQDVGCKTRRRPSQKSRDVASLRKTKPDIKGRKEKIEVFHKTNVMTVQRSKSRKSGVDSVPFAGVSEHVRAAGGQLTDLRLG